MLSFKRFFVILRNCYNTVGQYVRWEWMSATQKDLTAGLLNSYFFMQLSDLFSVVITCWMLELKVGVIKVNPKKFICSIILSQ
jgi:hypothetical protein